MTARPVARTVVHVVALASATGRYGGPFDTALRQADLIARDGGRAHIAAGSFLGDEPRPRMRLHHRPVRHLLGRRSFADVGSPAAFRLVVRQVRAADIVHVSFAREPLPLLAALVARLFGKPVVLQPHGMLTSRMSRAHRVFDALVTRRLVGPRAIVIALTTRERDALARWHPRRASRVRVMGNPPPVTGVAQTPSDRTQQRTALFAARLHPRKRVMDFARAAAHAHAQGWDDHYRVIGPDEGDLSALLTEQARTPRLDYAGATDAAGVVEELARSSVFVLPSRDEPWGNVLVSALFLGRPVVVTKSAALAPCIGEAGAGIVVGDDDPVAIAEAVHRLLEPAEHARAGRAAVDLARGSFSDDRVVERLRELYAEALTDAARRGVRRS